MRLRRLAPLASGLLAVAAACSSFTAEPDPSVGDGDGGADAAPMAPALDAAIDPIDTGSAVQGNLLSSPGFEDGCAVWRSTDSRTQPYFDPIDAPIIHGGAHACRVCATGDGGLFTITQQVPRPGRAGAKVAGSIWVHANGDAGGGLDAPLVTLVTSDDGGFTLEHYSGPGPKVDGTWKSASTALTATEPFARVELRFSAVAPAVGYCYVVDDAILTVTDP